MTVGILEQHHDNGLDLPGGALGFDALDRRTRTFKRYAAIRSAVLRDMGGEDRISEVQKQLVAKFATLALQLEILEHAAIEGAQIDLDLFGRCSAHLRRLGESLGMTRVPREVVVTLSEYLRSKKANVEVDA